MFDMRLILYVNGILLLLMAVAMLIPLFLDLLMGNDDWITFAESAFMTGFAGGMLFLTNRGFKGGFNLRQAFIFTSFTYVLTTAFGAMPFYLSEQGISYTDAFFEASSGISTTGASVFVGLDTMPPGLLLWRSLMNALGGIGVVVLALAVLPMLQIGGMQLFRTESSDKSEKMLPRTTQLAGAISSVYLILWALCALCLWFAGMNGFDAINHAMATIATGGFSTHDNSIGYFESAAIDWVCIVFMILGSLPFILFYQFGKGRPMALLGNVQVQGFLWLIALSTAILVIWLMFNSDYELGYAIRKTLFSVVTVVSTTGFSSIDYGTWGAFPTTMFFMLLVVGGCTGSTSGGIKIFRFQILYETTKAQVHRLVHPHGVFIPKYDRKPISDDLSASVMSFIILFGISFILIALALSLYDLDFLTAMSASAQALANVGPGLGPIIGPVGNYSTLPDGAKWILSFAMILGRLELFTVLVLLSPYFWRS